MVELTPSSEDGVMVQPTFAPNAGDRQVSTRSTAGSKGGKQSPEVRECACAWVHVRLCVCVRWGVAGACVFWRVVRLLVLCHTVLYSAPSAKAWH